MIKHYLEAEMYVLGLHDVCCLIQLRDDTTIQSTRFLDNVI